MEIVTDALDPAQLEAELPRVREWLARHGIKELYVTFGVGAQLPQDQQTGSFAFGMTDLNIYDAATPIETSSPAFSFCHESDLHFRSADRALVEEVKREWISRGYRGHETPAADIGQPCTWTRFP